MKAWSSAAVMALASVFLAAPAGARPDKKLTVSVRCPITMPQGEKIDLKVMIKRANFDKPVTLKFKLPKRVTVEGTPRFEEGETSKTLKLVIAEDAPIMESQGVVVGAAGLLKTVPVRFKIKVVAKK